MTEPNPFAPSQESVIAVPTGRATRPAEIGEALRQLAAHTADVNAMERERQVAGPRIRTVTMVVGGLFAVALLGTLLFGVKEGGGLLIATLTASLLFALFAIILFAVDLSLVPRTTPSTPEAALKSYLRAINAGRPGYSWAALAPTARAQVVAVPALGPVVTQPGELSMQDEAGTRAYFGAFARPGNGQIRQLTMKKVTLANSDGDVARVGVELTFYSYPQWVSLLVVLGFMVARPLVLVGLVVLLVMRKRCTVAVQKTLLRAPTGVWYIHDADLLESRHDLG